MSRCPTAMAILGAGLVLAGGFAMSGSRGDRSEERPHQFLPDLDDQPKYKAQSESHFFKEFDSTQRHGERWGRTMRTPVAGTVPFGRHYTTTPVANVDYAQRATFLQESDAVYKGRNPDGSFVERIPLPVTAELIALGRDQFSIYCIVCHGGTGEGDGMVGRQWNTPVPNWHDPKYIPGESDDPDRWKDGFFFDTLRNGVPNAPGDYSAYKMRPYGARVSVEESWAIVAYIRTLQMTKRGTLNMLNETDRRRLEAQSRPTSTGGAS